MPRRTHGPDRPRPQANNGELLRYIAEQLQRDAEQRWYRDHPAVSYKDRHPIQKRTA